MLTKQDAHKLAHRWGGPDAYYPCNREGAHAYGCSSHGGYIVDPACFTPEERARLDVALDAMPNQGWRTRNFPPNGPAWFFEEDCDWAILHVCTTVHEVKVYPNQHWTPEAMLQRAYPEVWAALSAALDCAA